jgi:hypothetical protein
MKINKKIKIEIEKYKCDFCNTAYIDYHGYNNRNNGRQNTIIECQICKKDTCKKHRHIFSDSYVTNDGFTYCNTITTCFKCKPVVEKIWEEERKKDGGAEYNGSLVYNVDKLLKEMK